MNPLVWNGVMWNHLIYPEHSPIGTGERSLLANWVDTGFPDYVVCLSLDGVSQVESDLLDVLHSLLPEDNCALAGFTHGNCLYFCAKTSDSPETTAGVIEKLRDNISDSLSISCSAGLAFLKEKTLYGLSWAAQRAVVSQRRKLREGAGKTYLFNESYIPAVFSFDVYRGIEKKLFNMIRSGDASELDSYLAEIGCLLFTGEYLALNHLRPILQTQIILASQELTDLGADAEESYKKTENVLSQMSSTYDYPAIKSIFEDAIRWFVHKSAQLCTNRATKIVTIAEELIKARLIDPDLNLKMLAELICTNPSYLSRTFKQHNGQGIAKYINSNRIRLAKRLLSNRIYSITEIAYKVGFSSLTHFERTFKAITNTTPSNYRKSKNVENK